MLTFLQLDVQRRYHSVQPLYLRLMSSCISTVELLTGKGCARSLFLGFVLAQNGAFIGIKEDQCLIVQVQHRLDHRQENVDALLIEKTRPDLILCREFECT